MENVFIDSEQFAEIKTGVERGLAAGDLMGREQIAVHLKTFTERFGVQVLRQTAGPALLSLMHGRAEGDAKCLAYWLEFKNDDEFPGNRFGGIGGGSALKYGIFQRQTDAAWVTGTPKAHRVIPLVEAVRIATRQRDELVSGADVLAEMGADRLDDQAYSDLQRRMEQAAPNLAGSAWAHKYWFLLFSDRLDDYHSPRYQRFHLIKLLQMPPDRTAIMDASGPRFLCAGRYISMARTLDVHVSTLNRFLNQRDGAFHSYWRIGTTEGAGGESQWPLMLEGGYVALGWPGEVPDLTPLLGRPNTALKSELRDFLRSRTESPAAATRKAGEIRDFAQVLAEHDLVVACEGQTVKGIGRVTGPYQYEEGLRFPHKRPVEWLSAEQWRMPEREGLQTTVFPLRRSAENLLEVERHLRRASALPRPSVAIRRPPTAEVRPLPPLDALSMRVETILQRKGQVILYGPPGTGKTHQALKIARELAARRAFGMSFDMLDYTDRAAIGPSGFVRLCTFHAGYGYEDFVEGLRPRVSSSDQMVFEPRPGVFKQICMDARDAPGKDFILIIDEINRGDLPRVLGELMTGLECDKRDLPLILPVTQATFSVPKNVYLIGTMNTADRSISLLDAAIRRRFGFVELMPDSSQLGKRQVGGLPLGPWLDALNTRVRKHLKRDSRNLQIGHAYLSALPITSVAEFARVLRDEIIPLLEEYCYDDFETLRGILGPEIVDTERARIRDEIFAANAESDLIQAISFPEMELLALETEPEEPDGEFADDDGDDVP